MQPEMESRQQERVALFIFLFCSHRDLPHHLNLYNAARHLLIDESKKITSPDTERTAAPGEDFGTRFLRLLLEHTYRDYPNCRGELQ
jgi:hypothetical protein